MASLEDADVRAFRKWLKGQIRPPLCADIFFIYVVTLYTDSPFSLRSDAEPRVLAKYIVALVKKDVPSVSEHKKQCVQQLRDFLRDG